MKITGYSKRACFIAMLVVQANMPGWAIDAKSEKNQTPTKVTWQNHLLQAQKYLHNTPKELEEQKRKNVKLKYPFSKEREEELRKGRIEVDEGLKLALQTMPPLAGLKDKPTATNVMWLVTAAGFVNAMDAIPLAATFGEYKKPTTAQQLERLRRIIPIARRGDVTAQLASAVVDRAFGTKGEKVQWKGDKDWDPSKLEKVQPAFKKAAAETHQASVDAEREIAKLEKQLKSGK